MELKGLGKNHFDRFELPWRNPFFNPPFFENHILRTTALLCYDAIECANVLTLANRLSVISKYYKNYDLFTSKS